MTPDQQAFMDELDLRIRMFEQNKLPAGFQSMNMLLRDHGQFFEKTPQTYVGDRGEPGNCFGNATELVRDDFGLVYVEGWVILHGIMIHHAWVVEEGTRGVIDPTLNPDLFRGPDDYGPYFGVPISRKYLRDALRDTGYYGIFSHTNPDIFRGLVKPQRFLHPKYKARP
jgi:hypothetical protein